MTPSLEALAWEVIREKWMAQGLMIGLAGIIPAEFFAYQLKSKFTPAAFFWRRLFSVVVVVLCLSSAPLLYDTYLLESQGNKALARELCVADLHDVAGEVSVVCPDAPVTLLRVSKVFQLGPGYLMELPTTGLPIAFVGKTVSAIPAGAAD